MKVIDLGLCTRNLIGEELTDGCGAFTHQAPEVFLRLLYGGPKADVWSLGVILYCVVRETLPFVGETFLQVQQEDLEFRYDMPSYISMSVRNVIVQMLMKNPSERPTLIVGHP
jgi:serine/threonine protein kinase